MVSVPLLPNVDVLPNFGLVNTDTRSLEMTEGREKVCITESCIKTAARLLKQMDSSADPCQDFYQYACGGFTADTILPEHKTRLGSYDLLRDELNKKLKSLFESKSDENEPKVYQGRVIVKNEKKSLLKFPIYLSYFTYLFPEK